MSWSQSIHSELRSSSQINIPDIQQVMTQRFLTLLTILLTILRTNTMAHDNNNNDHDGSKLTLPRFDPKDPTYFDDLQAYAQDRGLGWLLHADGDDTNDISKYDDMTSDKFQNLKTTGNDATDEDKTKATKWINTQMPAIAVMARSLPGAHSEASADGEQQNKRAQTVRRQANAPG